MSKHEMAQQIKDLQDLLDALENKVQVLSDEADSTHEVVEFLLDEIFGEEEDEEFDSDDDDDDMGEDESPIREVTDRV